MKENKIGRGAVLMVSASVVFCLMSGLVKSASDIDSYKITLFRFIIGLGLLSTAAMFGWIKLTFSHGPFLFLRGLIGGIAVFIFYLSISKLGLGKATVISYSFPIFGSICSVIFLKEKIKLFKAVAIVMAFCGIYLLVADANGGFSFWQSLGKYEAISVFGAVLGGLAVVLIKKLHDTDSAYAIFFAQCAVGLWLLIIPANIVPCSIGYKGGILLLCIGIAATVGQLLMTQGFRYVPVSTGSLLMMLTPVLNYLIGVTIFNEAISVRSIFGTAIVLGSCVVVLSAKDKS